MILDTSAVLAILLQEPESEAFRAAIIRAGTVLLSAGTCIELAAVAGRSATLRHDVESFLRQPYVRIEPVTASQAAMAGKAFRAWGKGHHLAALNLGDMLRISWPASGTCRSSSRETIFPAPTFAPRSRRGRPESGRIGRAG